MKRIVLYLICLISVTAALRAQQPDWYKFPVFCDRIDRVTATSDKIYYLSGGNLFSFAPSDNESYAYSSINSLSDESIRDIYYNPAKDYLLVVYDNSNLDLLFQDGTVINMPEIKDSSVSDMKTVNDVAFGGDRIVIATDFGLVIYSDTRYEVMESGIYNVPIDKAIVMGDNLVIWGMKGTDNQVLAAPLDARHNSLDKYTLVFRLGLRQLTAVDDTTIALRSMANDIMMYHIDPVTYRWSGISLDNQHRHDSPFFTTKSGVYTRDASNLLKLTSEGINAIPLPDVMKDADISFCNQPDKIWKSGDTGISCYDITQATPTVVYDDVLFQGATSTTNVGFMRWSADGRRLYISNLEASKSRTFASVVENSDNYQTTNIIEDGMARDVSLKNASADHTFSAQRQAMHGNKRMYGDPSWIIEDPDDPDKYYCCSFFEGLYVIKRNPQTGEYEEIGKFTGDNSPIHYNNGCRVLDVNIDRNGNLWMGFEFGDEYAVLPADKRRADPSTIKTSDWKSYKKLESLEYANKDLMTLMCRKSNMVFMVSGVYEKGMVVIDTKGTYDNPADDEVRLLSRLVDQDGNNLSYTFYTFLLEDERGCVWVGTDAGIFEFTNPSAATDANMTVRRIKVPRNDGTNFADYLLDTELINWMCLDPSGRKWVATDASGLYLVSETGDRIIRNYDTSNSPLISNRVTAVECSRDDNTVYVGTTVGLYSFKSDASPGREDYSAITAYPNPVRPEYSGAVTITGLMDHSVVKIADSAGNVVAETRSEGGMATWDVCNRSGKRVSSGVYYVFASAGDGTQSSGAVTKILVIN